MRSCGGRPVWDAMHIVISRKLSRLALRMRICVRPRAVLPACGAHLLRQLHAALTLRQSSVRFPSAATTSLRLHSDFTRQSWTFAMRARSMRSHAPSSC